VTDVTQDDFVKLGECVARLYSMALNGVVCDPTDPCEICKKTWDLGVDVLRRHDPKFASMGPERTAMFMPEDS
jgi:hypothetical protein